jgi:hypothetical protein
MSQHGLDPSTTAVVVLGASEWPDATQFEAAPQFANSAREFINFIVAQDGASVSDDHVLDLFDSNEEQSEIVRQIADFLGRIRGRLSASGRSLTDVVTFYVGHGGFDTGSISAYFLAIRRTNRIDYLGSSLSAASLRRALRLNAGGARHYLILDCCFAAAAVTSYIQMSTAMQTAVAQVQDSFPPSGTALLCAAGARVPAKAKRDSVYTMFSEGLLEVLRGGVANAPAWLTMTELGDAIRTRLRERYADEAVRPEVHSPEQTKGSVADVPIFRNALAALQGPIVPAAIQPTQGIRNPTQSPGVTANLGQFIREFQEEDIPPVIGLIALPYELWLKIPPPVKTLLIDYANSRLDRLTRWGSAVASAISIAIFISLIVDAASIPSYLTRPLATVSGLLSLYCMVIAAYFLRVLVFGRSEVDKRTLRPLEDESEQWEKVPMLDFLRYPRTLIQFRNRSFLRRDLYRVTLGATLGLSSGLLFLTLFAAGKL